MRTEAHKLCLQLLQRERSRWRLQLRAMKQTQSLKKSKQGGNKQGAQHNNDASLDQDIKGWLVRACEFPKGAKLGSIMCDQCK